MGHFDSRRLGRFQFVHVVLVVGGALVVAARFAGGFVHPPVLADAPEASVQGPPRVSLEEAELELSDGVVLRGVQERAADGAPLVLHMIESGGAVAARIRYGDRYDRLSDAGFSSLALDYRGCGGSGGERDPGRLVADAREVYQHALDLVGGDGSRIVLRATSIGTPLVAALLAGGARPGAIVAFAPVEARSIVRRFAAQHWWGPAYWPVAPFLRVLTEVPTLQTLADAPCPVLIVVDGEDCFMSSGEVQRVRSWAAETDGLEVVVPESGHVAKDGSVDGFQRHMAVVGMASRLLPSEARFLESLDLHDEVLRARVDALRESLPERVKARLDGAAGASRRLERIVLGDRRVFPEAAAAASLQLVDDEIDAAMPWIASRWFRDGAERMRQGHDPYAVTCPRSFDDLMGVFELDEEDGWRWPALDVVKARALLKATGYDSDSWVWSDENLRALALAAEGKLGEAQELARRQREVMDAKAGPDRAPWLGLEPNGPFLMVRRGRGGSSSGSSVMIGVFKADLEAGFEVYRRDGALLTLFRKAAWAAVQ